MTYKEQLNECLAAIKHGDATKYYELHHLTFGPLTSVAKIYLIDKSYAESVVSDLYEKLYRYADRYDTSKDAFNYLWQIVKNRAFDYNKKHRKDNWINIEDLPICDNVDPYEISNARMDIEMALQSVKDPDRLIVRWTYIDGVTQDEIGKRLGISKSAVCQRLKKTMAKLHEYLK